MDSASRAPSEVSTATVGSAPEGQQAYVGEAGHQLGCHTEGQGDHTTQGQGGGQRLGDWNR